MNWSKIFLKELGYTLVKLHIGRKQCPTRAEASASLITSIQKRILFCISTITNKEENIPDADFDPHHMREVLHIYTVHHVQIGKKVVFPSSQPLHPAGL